MRIESDGRLAMFSLAGPSGQGHETVFPGARRQHAGLAGGQRSSCAYNDVAAPKLLGTGSFGSRSLISHGAALAAGAKEIVEKGTKLAAKRAGGRRPPM